MADKNVNITLSATDKTRGAFSSAQQGLNKLSATAATLRTTFGALGATVGAGALVAFAKSGIDAADALNDMSQRLGVSVKDLASFKLAAEQSGTSLDGIGAGIARLSRSIGDAERGNKQLAAAIKDLGITSRDPKEAFLQLADAVERIQDPSQRATLLSQVLGKSYGELVPLLNQGGAALRASAAASETFAESMARLAPEADKFNDQLAEMKQNAAGAAASILGKLVPSFNEYIAVGREVIKTGTLLDKIRFFGLGNASDEIVGKVRKAAEAAAKASAAARKAAGADTGIKLPAKTVAAARGPKATDPLASLLGSTDIGKTKEYDKLLGLLNARFKSGAKDAELYKQAVEALNKQFGKTQLDVFGNGAFKTADSGVADFIRQQEEAVRQMTLGIDPAEIAKLDDMLSNTDFSRLIESQERMVFLTKAFTEGIVQADGSLRKLSETEYLDAVKNDLGLVGEELEKTKSIAEELGLSFTSAFEDAIVGGKSFSDILKGLEQDIMRIITRKLVTEPLGNAVTGMLSSFGFANGGIMTSAGPMPLQAYASGGIASSPQVALFGEGSMNEAFVPLPDGKRIPVKMEGGGGQTVVYMTVNTPDANSFRKSSGQITAQMSTALSRARRNM